MKVGLIGCGAIGRQVAKAIDKEIHQFKLLLVYDKEKAKIDSLIQNLKIKPGVALNINQVVEKTDLIVEAASPKVVGELLNLVAGKRKDLLIMSAGGLLEHLDTLKRIKKERKCKIFLPSGAIAGLDGVCAAREEEIYSITLTTTKPPQAFTAAPYILQHKVDLKNINKPTLLFEGNSREAIKAFPKNINVSATLSLAGVGIEKTKVRIIADPDITKNKHRIQIKGVFGEMEIIVENIPSLANPKTSYLAALSAVATLKKIVSPVKIGT